MDLAVKVRNCSFSYGKKKNLVKVLDNIKVSVPCGIIYALLGPSGCGKTTLLKVITGQLKGKGTGEICVFGSRPKSKGSIVPGPGVGYMPQELALYEDLTTMETLQFFGRLNLVDENLIWDRIDELFKILDLPKTIKNKQVKTLSGGQQRRVSLATALLHNPPLLILDEPTVGVDPLLRKEIWSYLVNLTATIQTSIIITTHYIEEARDADIIGAMRMGRILVEASPSLIISTFHDKTLESCFYKMCYLDSAVKDETSPSEEKVLTNNAITFLNQNHAQFLKENPSKTPFSMLNKALKTPNTFSKVTHLIKRNLILRSRNIPFALFQILIPLVSTICFTLVVGTNLIDVKIAIANEEAPQNFSQSFVDFLDQSLVSHKNYDLEGALKSVISAETRALVHIKKNFTNCVLNRLHFGLDVDNETLICSSISAYFDNSNYQVFYSLYASFLKSAEAFYGRVYSDLGKTPLLARLPIDPSKPVLGELYGRVGDSMIPGIVLITLHFLAAGCVFLVVFFESQNGMVDKLWTSSVAWVDILLSHIMSELAFITVQSAILLVYLFYIYGANLEGSIILLFLITLSQGIVGIALGFFISSILPMDKMSTGIIFICGLQFAVIITNGIFWPIEGMSLSARTVAKFFPLTTPIESFKSIMFRGWGLSNVNVILGFASAFVWSILYFGLALLFLK